MGHLLYYISLLYRSRAEIFPRRNVHPGSYIHHGHLETNVITYCNPNTLSQLSPNSHIGI